VQLQLGLFYAADKQQQKAIDIFTEILKQKPDNPFVLRNRGDAWLGLGKLKEAIADYEAALKLDGDDSGVLNNLAWLLATAPDDGLRDGKRAIELAKTAARLTEFKQAHILSTLAAAYAESGDFDNAKTWSKKAVDLAGNSDDDKEIREQLQKELASYEAKKPWRETFEPQPSHDPEPEPLPEPAEPPKN
jgi:Flp pilus assembly protein TadD